MNADRLLAHYEKIADAPDAIRLLRRFILELAVRGKLVEQNPNDEPAETVLERVVARKEKQVNAGKIRSRVPVDIVKENESPFGIPATWCWVRFGNIADFSAGRTPSRSEPSYWTSGDHPWVSIADIEDGATLISTKETVTKKSARQVFGAEPEQAGTIIMSFKLTIGKIGRLGIPAYHNEAIIAIRPYVANLDPYLFKTLPMFARQGNMKGAIKGNTLNRKSISNILLPLPPLAEQHRIVAKVDELMGLCDRLQTERTAREATRDRLMSASLARLNAPEPDPAAFRDHATFALDNLIPLTTRPDQIKTLRQTIFNLAVQGKLVEQDPNDEPASELLKRIAAERMENRNNAKPTTNLASSIAGYEVPPGWVIAGLHSVCASITDGDHAPPPQTESGIPFLVIGNVRTQTIEFKGSRFVSPEYYKALDPIRRPRGGDILYTLVGSFGIPVVVSDDQPFCVQRHIGVLRPSKLIDVGFLARAMESNLVFKQASACATGIAQKTVPLSGLRRLLIPLPPISEQHRIVAKVNEVMVLCDQLEVSLTTGNDARRRLLDALLHVALAPSDEETRSETSTIAQALPTKPPGSPKVLTEPRPASTSPG